MIVKNASRTLRACLQSVQGIVDEIVIADTGSSDDSCAIAQEFGATIVAYPWQDHFADARNAGIAAAVSDWILVLDADEELDPAARFSIRALLAEPRMGGYVVPIREYTPAIIRSVWTNTLFPNESEKAAALGANAYFINPLCRLFRRHEQIRFKGRVHEMVQPQVEAAGFEVAQAPFYIHHYGHLATPEALMRKRNFYNDLIGKRLADDATDVNTLTLYGLDEWEVHRRAAEALRYFRRAIELKRDAFEPRLLSAKVMCAVHQYKEAMETLDELLGAEKDLHLQYTLRGDALRGLGRLEEARCAYDTALLHNPKDQILLAKQDYIEVDIGDAEAAIMRLKARVAQMPGDVEIHELYINACIRKNRIVEAADEAERFAPLDEREAFPLRAAKLLAQLKQWERARAMAEMCVSAHPHSIEGHQLLMMSLIALGRLADAAAEAELLTTLAAEPRSFLRAAGIYLNLEDHAKARRCLERGAAMFPSSEQLQRALEPFHSRQNGPAALGAASQ
jgi:glycosyltransferase involved in cell wall biosynthesis